MKGTGDPLGGANHNRLGLDDGRQEDSTEAKAETGEREPLDSGEVRRAVDDVLGHGLAFNRSIAHASTTVTIALA
jgi:hypothetical protein